MRKSNRGFKAILGTALLVSVASVSFYTGKHSVETPDLGENVVYKDDNVKIEVIEVSGELTDVYVEPINGNKVIDNISDDASYEIDAYMTVISEKQARKNYNQLTSDFPELKKYDFNW